MFIVPATLAHEASPKLAGAIVKTSATDEGAQGYLVLPSSTAGGKRPAIILIQEWWGLTDWIKQNADRYAAEGYVVVAPDLYRGKIGADADEAHQLMRGLPEDRAMGDMKAAFEFLAARPDVDRTRIAVAGWCMGGGYALALGVEEPRLAGVITNYGRLITDPKKIKRIKSPVQGNFGGTDKGIPVEDVKAFEKALKSNGTAADFMIFEESGHGFMNPGNEKGYDKAAAERAWARMDAFFEKHLRGK
jgi:carboxymethylenebutenolidase